MKRIAGLALFGAFCFAGSASAQFPGGYGYGGGGYGGGGGGGYGYGGGLYGGGISPYLNLRRGVAGNPAANYFNFVRPYTGGYGNAFMNAPPQGGGIGRPSLFPNLRPIYDDDPASQSLTEDKDGVLRAEMPPAGRGAGFMNTMGYFGATGGMGGPAARMGTPTRRTR